MINIAGVEKKYFKEIVEGIKTVEYRVRKKPDSRLENTNIGEMLYLFCKGSSQVAVCQITDLIRNDIVDTDDEEIKYILEPCEYEYEIHFKLLKVEDIPALPHQQGWYRVEKLD